MSLGTGLMLIPSWDDICGGRRRGSTFVCHHHTTMSFALNIPGPRPRAVPLDWPIVTYLATQTTVMRELHTALIAHCDPAHAAMRVIFDRPSDCSPLDHLCDQLTVIAGEMDQFYRHSYERHPGEWYLRSSISKAIDQLRQFLPPLWLTAEVLSNLPAELYDIIVAHLSDDGATSTHAVSNLSLVSRSWARRFRPYLFRTLHLHSSADIQFLRKIVCSPLSQDLSQHIEVISIQTEGFPIATSLLYQVLPSLTDIHLRGDGADRNGPDHQNFAAGWVPKMGFARGGWGGSTGEIGHNHIPLIDVSAPRSSRNASISF